MEEILKEFYEAVSYIKGRGWETQFFIDCETTGKPIVPFISVRLSEDLTLNVILNDTYYIDIIHKTEEWCRERILREGIPSVPGVVMLGQVQYSPEGNITTTKKVLDRYTSRMTEHECSLFNKFIKDLYYFFKPNSINFMMD